MGEFELIERYFERQIEKDGCGDRVVLGIGDDCALLAPRAGFELAVSSDMLIEGRHFLADVQPEALGYKCLAVNLSDLAAMGALPLAFTLALALPAAEPRWLEGFAAGLFDCARIHRCPLVGGDTSAGALTISITVLGEVPAGQAIRRSTARPGDDVWVSGDLGDAALALRMLQGHSVLDHPALAALRGALERPTPRLSLGAGLRGLAHAMIDLSDGLSGDLRHVLSRSQVGASIVVEWLPASAWLARQSPAERLACQIGGGDDYELCFTAAPADAAAIRTLGRETGVRVTRIGSIHGGAGLSFVDPEGQPYRLPEGVTDRGFEHFG